MWVTEKKFEQQKAAFKKMAEHIVELEEKIEIAGEPTEPTEHKECEKCGCLVGGRHAKGEPEIRTRPWNADSKGEQFYMVNSLSPYGFSTVEEYVHKPIFCLRCAPKTKKKKA